MCYSEAPQPIVNIKKGQFKGEQAVLQYECEEHKGQWKMRLLDRTWPDLKRFGYDKSNKVLTVSNDHIQICLPRKDFTKTRDFASPLINTDNADSFAMLKKWRGKARSSVERFYQKQ
jgi:hypothetical protein